MFCCPSHLTPFTNARGFTKKVIDVALKSLSLICPALNEPLIMFPFSPLFFPSPLFLFPSLVLVFLLAFTISFHYFLLTSPPSNLSSLCYSPFEFFPMSIPYSLYLSALPSLSLSDFVIQCSCPIWSWLHIDTNHLRVVNDSAFQGLTVKTIGKFFLDFQIIFMPFFFLTVYGCSEL